MKVIWGQSVDGVFPHTTPLIGFLALGIRDLPGLGTPSKLGSAAMCHCASARGARQSSAGGAPVPLQRQLTADCQALISNHC